VGLEGLPHRLEVPIWHRGPARIVEIGPNHVKLIVLEHSRAQRYAVVSSSKLVFDLERVTSEETALQFVGKYGLLETDQDRTSGLSAASVMPLDKFLELAETVRTCLQIYRWLRPAVEGDPEALVELRRLEPEAREVTGRAGMGVSLEPAGDAFTRNLRLRARKTPAARATDAELLALLGQALAYLINLGLGGVEERVSASLSWPTPGEGADWPDEAFTVSVQPKTLLGAIFHHLALVILNRRPLSACERCASLYFKEDPRQRFCTVLCADRARRERHRGKQRKTAAGIDSVAKPRSRRVPPRAVALVSARRRANRKPEDPAKVRKRVRERRAANPKRWKVDKR
jgi:hypothetical protein